MVKSSLGAKIRTGKARIGCGRMASSAATLADREQGSFYLEMSMTVDRILHLLTRTSRRCARTAIIGLVAAIIAVVMGPHASAAHVGPTPGYIPDTSMNPTITGSNWNAPGHNVTWGQGDPGWANVGRAGAFNGVYIGDGWVLTANHVSFDSVFFEENGPSYNKIPASNVWIKNPINRGVPEYSDLHMWRIDTDANLPSLKISTQAFALNDEVVTMSWGILRASAETHWSVNTSTDPYTYTEVGSCSINPFTCHYGYKGSGIGKRWGVNQIADDALLGGPEASDGDINYNPNGWTIGNLTEFNQWNGNNPFESQVVGGDSGSGVFRKRNGQWELAGINLNNITWLGQAEASGNNWSAYGNFSVFADLSNYASQIEAVKSAPDFNLDGVVTGNGTGSMATDDISAFVAGWGYDNELGYGTMTSWRNGDLTGPLVGGVATRDGKTDVLDFLKMRSVLAASPGSAAALDAMFNGSSFAGGVPEPSAILLVIGPTIWFALIGRKRRPRRMV